MVFSRFLFALVITSLMPGNSYAQYKRRGEILQSRLQKASTPQKKANYTLSQLQGRWQEFERKKRSDSSITLFKDSIQLKFNDSNKVMTRTSIITSMAMEGEAQIDDDNVLTAAADEYVIKSVSANEIVLDDNDLFIHRLKKVDHFWYETLGKTAITQNEYNNPVSAKINDVLGRWAVYRRRADPGTIAKDALLIKYLSIPNKINENTASGNIGFYNNQLTQEMPCTLLLNGSEIKITAGNYNWTFSVYQTDTGNFVFGNNNLMYFCKPTTNK
ncbi:MAG TPA: hypothetical protein VMT76_00410 [Puia sp.]|nr:hypothetical protein [Puia sp.]